MFVTNLRTNAGHDFVSIMSQINDMEQGREVPFIIVLCSQYLMHSTPQHVHQMPERFIQIHQKRQPFRPQIQFHMSPRRPSGSSSIHAMSNMALNVYLALLFSLCLGRCDVSACYWCNFSVILSSRKARLLLSNVLWRIHCSWFNFPV